MESISLSEARAKFEAVVDRVVADCAPVAITRHKGEGVVLVSASDWASIGERLGRATLFEDTEPLLEGVRCDQDAPRQLARLQAAIDEGLASGSSERTVEDIIADRARLRAGS